MSNYNKYSDEVNNFDPAEVERLRQKREKKRRELIFIAKMFLYHLAACVIYIIIFSPSTDAEVAHDTNGESYILAFFSVLAITLFSFIISLEISSSGETQREFTNRMKTESLSPALFFSYVKERLIGYSVIYLIFQLPFAVFHLFFGFEYVRPTVIDNLYTMDAGLMELIGIGFVGAILNVLLFAALLTLFNYLTFRRWKSEIL